jgi:hypothetical protein
MHEVADSMFASPDYTDRDEARQEKVSGSWGEYVSDELVAALDAQLGSHFTLVEFDCDHMVAQAKPAETAELIRRLAV